MATTFITGDLYVTDTLTPQLCGLQIGLRGDEFVFAVNENLDEAITLLMADDVRDIVDYLNKMLGVVDSMREMK